MPHPRALLQKITGEFCSEHSDTYWAPDLEAHGLVGEVVGGVGEQQPVLQDDVVQQEGDVLVVEPDWRLVRTPVHLVPYSLNVHREAVRIFKTTIRTYQLGLKLYHVVRWHL